MQWEILKIFLGFGGIKIFLDQTPDNADSHCMSRTWIGTLPQMDGFVYQGIPDFCPEKP